MKSRLLTITNPVSVSYFCKLFFLQKQPFFNANIDIYIHQLVCIMWHLLYECAKEICGTIFMLWTGSVPLIKINKGNWWWIHNLFFFIKTKPFVVTKQLWNASHCSYNQMKLQNLNNVYISFSVSAKTLTSTKKMSKVSSEWKIFLLCRKYECFYSIQPENSIVLHSKEHCCTHLCVKERMRTKTVLAKFDQAWTFEWRSQLHSQPCKISL